MQRLARETARNDAVYREKDKESWIGLRGLKKFDKFIWIRNFAYI